MKRIAILLLSVALSITGLSFISGEASAEVTGAPGIPTGVAGYGFIDVSWTAAPGSPLNYYVYWSSAPETVPGEGVDISGSTSGPVTTYHVETGGLPDWPHPLPADYVLYFQVCAHYASGDVHGQWSGAIHAGGYPSAPLDLHASNSTGDLVLTWNAPASIGGMSITSYHINRSTTSGAETTLASVSGATLTFTDLAAAGGMTYFYKISASNGYWGPQSAEASATMPPGKPGVVKNLQGIPSDGKIDLSWNVPDANGGSEITHYNIYRSVVSGDEALIGSTGDTTRSYEDVSAVLGETYFYQVTAVNSMGESAKCAEVQITFIQTPSVPRQLIGVAGSGQIELTWLAPLDNGGSAISYYDINRKNVTGGGDWEIWYSWTEGQTYFNDTNVQLGCTYQYCVMAWNDYYESLESNNVTVLYALLPSEPFNVNLAPGAGTMLVTWNAPNSTGGSPLESYWVFWGTSPGTMNYFDCAELSTSYTITGLAQDTEYYVTVAANNSAGRGQCGSDVTAMTPTVPGAVEDLMVLSGDGQASLSWNPPGFNGRSGVTYYSISRGTSAGNEDQFIGNAGSNCSWIDSGLVNGHTYYYSVIAHNAVGTGPGAEQSVMPATAPSPPTNVHASGSHVKITVTWNQPVDLGGGILHYQIYRGATWGDATLLITLGNVTSYEDTVGKNESWSYWVLGQNWGGVGPRSSPATAISFGDPGAPSEVSTVAGNGYINLTWAAPLFDGNTPLTGYSVYRSNAPGTETSLGIAGTDLFYNDTTALNGQIYYYVVRATNAYYLSGPSGEVHATPLTVPSAPSGMQATPGLGNVTVDWTAPDDGGNAIDGYLLEYGTEAGGIIQALVLGNINSFVITGLDDNTSYVFTVTAHNQVGYGAMSETASASTFGLPWMAVLVLPDIEDSRVHLSWNAPANGGVPITNYLVYRSEISGAEALLADAGSALSYTDVAVINGRTYYYTLKAVNMVGEGVPSGEVSARPAKIPGTPSGLTVDGDIAAIHLAWSAPADMGGGVLHYLVYRGTSPGGELLFATLGNLTSYDDMGLEPGAGYYYRVAAQNWAGAGPLSAEGHNFSITVPGAPTEIAVNSEVGLAHISWTAPADNGNSPLLGYRLYRSTVSGTETMLVELGLVLQYDDRAIINGTAYFYKVRAFNLGYEGTLSSEESGTPFSVPSAPADLVAVGGLRAVTLSWGAASDCGSTIDYYIVYQDGVDVLHVSGTPVIVSGLINGTTYAFRVAAHNSIGSGPTTLTMSATTFSVPAVPGDLSVVANADNVTISWSEPEGGAATITGYVVYRISDGVEVSMAAIGASFIDDTVSLGKSYAYRVVAVNIVGPGSSSIGTGYVTPAMVPGMPSDLTAIVSVGKVALTWAAPSINGGLAIDAYHVYRGTDNGSMVKIATISVLNYTDESGVKGAEYLYKVTSANAKGEGEASSISATSLFPPPAPTSVNIVRSASSAIITWTMPIGNASSGTVSKFAIYRSDASGQEVLIAEVNGSEAMVFTDTTAPDTTTDYRVVAVNGDTAGFQSSQSTEATLPAKVGGMDLVPAMIALLALASIMLILLMAKRGRKKGQK